MVNNNMQPDRDSTMRISPIIGYTLYRGASLFFSPICGMPNERSNKIEYLSWAIDFQIEFSDLCWARLNMEHCCG